MSPDVVEQMQHDAKELMLQPLAVDSRQFWQRFRLEGFGGEPATGQSRMEQRWTGSIVLQDKDRVETFSARLERLTEFFLQAEAAWDSTLIVEAFARLVVGSDDHDAANAEFVAAARRLGVEAELPAVIRRTRAQRYGTSDGRGFHMVAAAAGRFSPAVATSGTPTIPANRTRTGWCRLPRCLCADQGHA